MTELVVIVEWTGDESATKLLVRRLLQERLGVFDVNPIIQRRNGVAHLKAKGWEKLRRYLQAAFCEEAPVLWLFDSEDECPVHLLKEIAGTMEDIDVRFPLAFGLWYREFETMFMYCPECIEDRYGVDIPGDAIPEPPERIRGAKEWISKQLPKGQIYKESIDQEKMVANLDLQKLNAYRPFVHLESSIRWLLNQAEGRLYPYDI